MTYQYDIPTAGSTISMGAGVRYEILDPATSGLTFTVNLPPNPTDGDVVEMASTQPVNHATVSTTDGSAVIRGDNTIGLGPITARRFLFIAAKSTWYPA